MTDHRAARILELSQLAFFATTRSGIVTDWNRATADLYGYSAAETVGRSADFLCFPGESTVLMEADDAVSVNDPVAVVERHRHYDGSEVFVDIKLTSLDDGLLAFIHDATGRRQAEVSVAESRAALGTSRRALDQLGRRILEAQETERRRIARDLHDDFKQRLGALGFELAALAEGPHQPTKSEEGATRSDLSALVDQVADLGRDIRQISHQIHPAALERLGLVAALEAHAAEIEHRKGLAVRVTIRDVDEPLPARVALGLYRIAQEALENAVRYSGAREAHVSLVRDHQVSTQERTHGTIRLAVADDGVGFDLDEAWAKDGLGLASMEERAQLLGGHLRVASAPGAGTEIELILPVADEIEGEVDERSLAATSDAVESTDGLKLIGPYQLLATLGEGATATVYLAEEPPPLARQVAIKLYHPTLAGPGRTLSFKAERQALARLQHPNIGQIYEARTTEDTNPYIVMEYVPGMSIPDYCDRYRLDLRQRIEVFMTVCEAVQHVHQKGVLHRDLKPANVLVMERDGRAVPKIVDFGVAKGLGKPLAEGTVWNRGSSGTPAYISPEVAAGGEADTRSDVYSLGVMLYELLTGVLPADSEEEVLEYMQGSGFPPPSRRLMALGTGVSRRWRADGALHDIATRRQTRSSSLVRSLKGDLDWISRKVLAQDPGERYVSAAALAEDLDRYLRGQPVEAGPSTSSYRLARFTRRHRVAVVAMMLFVVALLGGFGTTAWQAQRASREAIEAQRAHLEAEQAHLEAEQVTAFLEGLFKVTDPRGGKSQSMTAQEILEHGAERLKRELSSQPRVKARLQETIGNVYRQMGLYDAAQPLLEEALEERRALFGEEHPETARSLRALGYLILEGEDPAAAEPVLEEALAAQKRLLGEDHLEVGRTLRVLAAANWRQGELPAAEIYHRRALELAAAISPGGQLTFRQTRDLARTVLAAGDLDEAEQLATAALGLAIEGSLSDEFASGTRILLAAIAYRRGDFTKAEELSQQVLRSTEPESTDPAVARPAWHPRVRAYAHFQLAEVFSDRGEHASARQSWETAAELTTHRPHSVEAQTLRATALLYLDRIDEARPIAAQALRGNRDHELIELCKRHGVAIPPLDGKL